MVWDHISITKPHLVYISLGSFATLFLLASSIIKEQLYLGEAIVATAFGVIFGPHATSLIDPRSWGSSDITTIEFARVVLVIQCFALGVELPGFYVFRHWRSLLLLLVPVMCFGWAVIGVAVWWMVPQLGWMESLIVAACLTPTDPILASSIVGNGRFAQRVPRHLRDLLSAESGCNDCMGLVFMYLALYILKYDNNPREFALKFFVYVVLYECIAGAIVGFVIGYVSRRGIKYAEQRGFIDRESFLVFYVFIALLCSGAGSVLGMDDLLVGFFAGIAFSNDGWFKEKTEESHITNIVDLMLNITFFVYFGTVIPWEQFGDGFAGLHAWRLVVAAVIIFLFRRIPAVVALKAWIPDVRTWREALFVGHFGPIGVGAIFIAMLARGQLEHGRRVPLPELPSPDDTKYYDVIRLIWPITAFMVVASALVHGSSVALFVLGKHIQTLNLTITYDFGSPSPTPPKISRPVPQRVDVLQKPHTSAVDFQDPFARLREVQDSPDLSEVAADGTSERGPDLEPPSPGGGLLTPRMAMDSYGWRRTPSRRSQEAMRNTGPKSMSENVTSRSADEAGLRGRGRPGRAYKYGSTLCVEDENGNVLKMYDVSDNSHANDEGESTRPNGFMQRLFTKLHQAGSSSTGEKPKKTTADDSSSSSDVEMGHHPTRDPEARRPSFVEWVAAAAVAAAAVAASSRRPSRRPSSAQLERSRAEAEDDRHIRFTMVGGGRRMNKSEFIDEVQRFSAR